MKKVGKVLLIILLVFALLVVVLAIWQRNNLKAIYIMLTNDEEQIARRIDEKTKEQHEKIKIDYDITVEALDSQKSEEILKGKTSAQEVKENLGIAEKLKEEPETDKKVQEVTKPVKKEENPAKRPLSEAEIKKKAATEAVDKCVAELYACEVDLMERLGVLRRQTIKKYDTSPKAEKGWKLKQKLAFEGMEECYNIEVEIDAQVREILSRYKTQLRQLGADTSVLDSFWVSYCEKKADKKAYYLNKYLK